MESPNDNIDEDKDFEDCGKDGQGVPDENNNLALVKGLNPKSQLHNSIVQKSNRNQKINQASDRQTEKTKSSVHGHSNSLPRSIAQQ